MNLQSRMLVISLRNAYLTKYGSRNGGKIRGIQEVLEGNAVHFRKFHEEC